MQKLKSRVSIITPTYNRRHFLPHLWHSINSQTLGTFNWIVVDDGSTDDTREYIKKIGDNRITYYRQENQGMNYARNTGITLNRSDYIVFLDSDDEFYDENTLEKLVEEISNAPDYIGAVAFRTIDQNGKSQCYKQNSGPIVVDYHHFICESLVRGEFIHIFREKVLGTARFPHVNAVEFLFYCNVAKNSKFLYTDTIGRIYHIDKRKKNEKQSDHLSGIHKTVANAKNVAIGLEEVIRLHGKNIRMRCPKRYGAKHFYAALYYAMAGCKRDSLGHLRAALINKGPKLKIALLWASLLLPLPLRNYLFITKTKLSV